jgi:hypothetical protein
VGGAGIFGGILNSCDFFKFTFSLDLLFFFDANKFDRMLTDCFGGCRGGAWVTLGGGGRGGGTHFFCCKEVAPYGLLVAHCVLDD